MVGSSLRDWLILDGTLWQPPCRLLIWIVMRADQLLVHQGLVPTRSSAQRLIDAGGVRWHGPKGWAVPRKAGEDLPEDCSIEVTDDAECSISTP